MKIKYLLISLAIITLSCTPATLPATENMLKNKSFVYLFYETEQECIDAQPYPDFFINCHQQIDFLKNNEVIVALSDILYRGIYRIEGNLVIIMIEDSPEVPDGLIVFELINPVRLYKIDNGTVWKKVNGNSIWR